MCLLKYEVMYPHRGMELRNSPESLDRRTRTRVRLKENSTVQTRLSYRTDIKTKKSEDDLSALTKPTRTNRESEITEVRDRTEVSETHEVAKE